MSKGSERVAQIGSRRLGLVAVSIATVVWASGTIIVKASSLGGLQFAMFRLWAGVAVSGVALLVTRRRLTLPMFMACAAGGLLFAGDIGFHFAAVKRTSVANVALIGALAPVVIAVVSARRLHERLDWRERAFVALSFAGVAVVALGSTGLPTWSPTGDLLALGGVATWTAYWFFSRHARATTPTLEYLACVMIAGALAMTPVALLIEGLPGAFPAADVSAVWAVAIFPGFVGHSLVIWSHRHVESWRSALITQCTPVLASLLAWVFLDEPITLLVAVGGAIVVVATAAVIIGASRRVALAGAVGPEATDQAT